MAEFVCSVCGGSFAVPDAALEKYPGWAPKYCRKHSPKKQAASSATGKARSKSVRKSATHELDLPLAEVLQTYTEGPDAGLFTDGSARPNPGPGGWGVVWVKDGSVVEQHYGSDAHTTNNIMELTALIRAYTILPESATETVYTDSELCVNILTKWAAGWQKNGWKRKSGPIKNLELVQELYALYQRHPGVKISWIKAHNGWLWNEYADSLATAWARDIL